LHNARCGPVVGNFTKAHIVGPEKLSGDSL
jgi:hypothetical protein